MKNHLACLAALAVLASLALAREVAGSSQEGGQLTAAPELLAQIHVPNRPSTPLFQGQQGRQKTEIHFDPATRVVTIEMLVQDPNGYFIPNIRRENFAVYEDGVRQQAASVEIEHGAVSVGLLLEHGGRYQSLNDALNLAVSMAATQFLDEIGNDDEVAIWTYGDKVTEICRFSREHEAPREALSSLRAAPFSELNFYDAVVETLLRMPVMQVLTGRKALLVISSGLDTFSKATYQDALQAAGQSIMPIYAIDLDPFIRSRASLSSNSVPYARLDWPRAESRLQRIARASGGRMYALPPGLDLAGVYDDLMENLRVRYVITYKSTADPDTTSARIVRIELIDSRTGGPLRIVDASGRSVGSKVIVEDSYVPHPVADGSNGRIANR
jgi:Ca-activated chloride channel homolog